MRLLYSCLGAQIKFLPRPMAPLTILCRRLRSCARAIAHRLYREDATRATYVARLKQLLDTVWNEEELLSLADEMAAIVQQHALAKRRADAARDADRVRQFIRERRAVILADLDPEPPAWPWPLAAADICWPERGAFDLHFETTWGSSASENPLGEGTVEFTEYKLGGKEQGFGLSGAIAGFEEDEGRTDKDRASVSIISLGKDFGHRHYHRFATD